MKEEYPLGIDDSPVDALQDDGIVVH